MKEKRLIGIFVLFVIAVVLLSAVRAVDAPAGGLDADQVRNQSDDVVQGVQQLQNFTSKDRLEYLGEEWKSLLLQNGYLSAADSFFQKFNWAFLFLFGREYELSLALLFAFLIWLATALMLPRYFVFLKEKWMRYLAGFAGAIVLAQMQIFNAIANLLIRFYFYRFEWWWKLISLVILLAGVGAYAMFLRYFGKIIVANKKKKAEEQRVRDQEGLRTVMGEIQDASRGNP